MHFLAAASKYLEGAGAMFLVSTFFQAMPPVPPTANYWLRWLYAGVQAVASNWNRAGEAVKPPLK